MEYLIILAILIAVAVGIAALKARKETATAPAGTGGPRNGADHGNPQTR